MSTYRERLWPTPWMFVATALVIPASALVVRQGGPHVMTVDAPNGPNPVVRLRPVQVGRDYGATVEVLDGVAEGATIVTNPSADLGDGARVRVTPPGR